MQGIWGDSPPDAIGFFVIITPKSCLMQDLEHILVNTRKYLTKYGVGGVVGATLWKI